MNLQQALVSAFHVVPFSQVEPGQRFRVHKESYRRSRWEWWDRKKRSWRGPNRPTRLGRRPMAVQLSYRGYEDVRREYPVLGPGPEYTKESAALSVDADGRDAIFYPDDQVVVLPS